MKGYTESLLKWIPIIIKNMRVKSFRLSLDYILLLLPSLVIESDHIQNLSLEGCEFNFPSEVRVYLQRLQRLSLDRVYIPEEILDSILSNCPFLEDVSLKDCYGFKEIKLSNNNNNRPTKLARFYFNGNHFPRVSIDFGDSDSECKPLEFFQRRRLSLTRVHMLSYSFSFNCTILFLCQVHIPEEILNSILSDCPFIENVSLLECRGFKRIKMLSNKPTNLEHFCFHGVYCYDPGVCIEIGDHIQTLKSIEIHGCLLSVSHNKPLECARLTRLSLASVEMLSELFSCKLHSLEELKLDQCYGIKDFKLSSRSMKHLSINNRSRPFKATIDAPSMVSFIYKGTIPRSISFATTSSDELWKSKINLESFFDEPSHCFNELYGLLMALSQSEISLEFDHIEVNITDDEAKHELPVVVEHLRIKRLSRKVHSNAVPFLNMLFHMFRPKFMYLGKGMLTEELSREIEEILFQERETVLSYFWQRVLEGASLQVKYRKQSEWQPVEHTSFTEVSKKGADGELELRIHLKWSD